MPSPFPGMDPYLEGYLWPDVHQSLASKIRQQLTPLLRPRYAARLKISVIEDTKPEAEVGIMYPDVEVVKVPHAPPYPLPVRAGLGVAVAAHVAEEVVPLTLPLPAPIEVRQVTVEVRDVAYNTLVTCIEILSPINKREPGLSQYLQKRQRLRQSGVHVLELDLLRRCTRTLEHARLPETPYLILLIRGYAQVVDVWSLTFQQPLPKVPVPLRAPDADVSLDLTAALAAIYDEAAYELSINYTQPPPPPLLSAEDEAWIKTVVFTP